MLREGEERNEDRGFALGRYRAKTLAPHAQYFDCDLMTLAPVRSRVRLGPGIFVGCAYEGGWSSRIEDRSLSMEGRRDIAVCGSGGPMEFEESQPENARIRMSAFYIGADFLRAESGEPPPEELLALLALGEAVCRALPPSQRLGTILRQMYGTPCCGYIAQLQMAGLLLLAAAELALALGAKPTPCGEPCRKLDLAHEAKRLLDASLASHPSIPDLAALLGASESSLRRAFKAAFGCSITAYVRERLLDQARVDLRESGLQIAEIAYRAGFSDPANFTTAYRRRFGHPPRCDR